MTEKEEKELLRMLIEDDFLFYLPDLITPEEFQDISWMYNDIFFEEMVANGRLKLLDKDGQVLLKRSNVVDFLVEDFFEVDEEMIRHLLLERLEEMELERQVEARDHSFHWEDEDEDELPEFYV